MNDDIQITLTQAQARCLLNTIERARHDWNAYTQERKLDYRYIDIVERQLDEADIIAKAIRYRMNHPNPPSDRVGEGPAAYDRITMALTRAEAKALRVLIGHGALWWEEARKHEAGSYSADELGAIDAAHGLAPRLDSRIVALLDDQSTHQIREDGARYTIEPDYSDAYKPDGVRVCRWTKYPRHSVLAGQDRKNTVDYFDSQAKAIAAYPHAEVLDRPEICHNTTSHLPGPDDQEPGGAWPDDWTDGVREPAAEYDDSELIVYGRAVRYTYDDEKAYEVREAVLPMDTKIRFTHSRKGDLSGEESVFITTVRNALRDDDFSTSRGTMIVEAELAEPEAFAKRYGVRLDNAGVYLWPEHKTPRCHVLIQT